MGLAPRRAKRAGRLDEELERLGRIPLVICDKKCSASFTIRSDTLYLAYVKACKLGRKEIVAGVDV